MFKKKSKQVKTQEPIVPTEAVSEVVQPGPIIESQSSAAERSLIAELSSLSAAGANAVPSILDVPISSPTAEPAQPQIDPAVSKVLAFLRVCHVTDGLTYKEISGGTELMISDVRRALDSLVDAGTVRHSGEAEAEANFRHYKLTAAESAPPAPEKPWRSPSEIWASEQRARALATESANRPPEPRRYEPTEADVQAALDAEAVKKTTLVLTPSERKMLDVSVRNRREINPQQFIKR